MPSILSSCLILLKLAMAVNDGLHSMLSNVYSVIENAMQSDHNRQSDMESVQESSSAPAFQRSKSQILEAFNRRRTNLAIYEQTDVLVSNLTPFQEITITNKDIEGRRKLTVSPRRSSRKRTRPNKDVESNVETPFPEKSPSLTDSQSPSPSLVSSETENESENHSSFKVIDRCTQVEEANDLCQDNMDEPIDTLEEEAATQTNIPTRINVYPSSNSRNSRSSTNKSPMTNLCLKSLQEKIRFISDMFRASESNSNAKPSVKNVWGLTVSDSTNDENVTEETRSNSAIFSSEDAVARKEFLEETTRLSEQFLRNYYARKDACTNLRKTPETSPRTKDSYSSSSSDSNKSHQTFEDNFTPIEPQHRIHRLNTQPSHSSFQANSSDEPSRNIFSSEQKAKHVTSIQFKGSSDSIDSEGAEFGYFSDAKALSKVSVTKHTDTVKAPLMLKKDSWINMDDVEFIKPGNLHKLSETSAWNKESNLVAHSKKCSLDFGKQIQPKDKQLSPSGTGKDAFEVSQDYQSTITPNLSCPSPSVCEEMDDSDDLEELGLARVHTLTKVLREVGATEILNESSTSKTDIHDLLNDISDATLNIIGVSSAASETKSATKNNKIPDFNDVPLADLDTEEKRINYLNNVTESYLNKARNELKRENISTMINIFRDSEPRYKTVLDSITSAYKNELDSLTQSAGMSLDPLIDTGLRTKYNIPFIEVEGTSNEDNCNTCVSLQQTSVPGELDAFGLPFFVQNESSKIESETANDLLDVDKDHSENSFSIDGRQNETSTPIRDEMIENQNWVSVNLSPDCRKESEVANNDAKSCIANKTCQNSTFTTKDVVLSVINNGMEGEVVWSPNTSRVKCGSTLEAKDWVDLEAEMSKNYLKCISILNMCDDEAEDANMKKESNCNASDMGKSSAGKTETLCKSEEDLVESGNGNAALPLISGKECLDVAQDSTNANNTRNLDGFEKRESEMVLKELNVSCSALNSKDISSAGSNSEELSKDNIKHALRSLDNALNCRVSVIRNFYLDSEDGSNKNEVQIADHTELEILSKPENASIPKNVLQNVSLGAVNNPAQIESTMDELLSSTNRVFVPKPLNELQIKISPCKKNILNKEFLLNDFNKEVECYIKHVERKDKNNIAAREVYLFHPSADHSNRELNFGYQGPNSCRISKQSIEQTSSSVLRTPISNIKALQKKEELETTRMYYDEGIYGSKPLITFHSDMKGNLNAGFQCEAGIQTSQNGNENKLDAEVNNTQIPENDLTKVSDTGSREAFVTKCESRDKADFDSEILN